MNASNSVIGTTYASKITKAHVNTYQIIGYVFIILIDLGIKIFSSLGQIDTVRPGIFI